MFSDDAINMFKGHIRTGSYHGGVAIEAMLSLIQWLRQDRKYLIPSKTQKTNVNYRDC